MWPRRCRRCPRAPTGAVTCAFCLIRTRTEQPHASLIRSPVGCPTSGRQERVSGVCGVRDLSGIVKAYDIRGVVGEQLDAGVVRDFGAAFARLVGGPAIVIGHDMRDSSPGLAKAFADGARA